MDRISIGLVGIGKIARDQHVPALVGGTDFDLAATASRCGEISGIEAHKSVDALIAARPDVGAISLCTPPAGRFDQAIAAIEAGRHVMLEKPPAATLSEAEALVEAARSADVTLFATWHSREAAAADAAREWLTDKRIDAVRIHWKEDIRQWHPGQEWILAPGGFGVFDPGINALSIVTTILPLPLRVEGAMLAIPANRASPIAASIAMRCAEARVEADFDFLQTGEQTWDIEVDTDAGMLRLRHGGSRLELPGAEPSTGPDREYRRLYARFAELIRLRKSDVDLRPLQLVADAFMLGRRESVAPFDF